jgi:methionine sulfoxide reductase heme-binding subunit
MPEWTSPGTTEPPAAAAPPARSARPASWRRPSRLGVAVAVLGAAPAALLAWRWAQGSLGADPVNAAIHASGWWALAWLLATLCVTPLRRFSVWLSRMAAVRWGRRLSDWNPLIRQRRQLGLWSFAYACLHLSLYAALDAGSLRELLIDIGERPFLAWGLAGFTLLLPLAATSTQGAIRRLKRNWARLHMLVYPAAGVALAHAWQQTKVGHDLPLGFVAMAVALLGCRLWAWRAGDRPATGEVEDVGRAGPPGAVDKAH